MSSEGNVKELGSRWESRHSIHLGAAKKLIPETRDTRRWNIDIIVADNSYSKTKIESHCWYHSVVAAGGGYTDFFLWWK